MPDSNTLVATGPKDQVIRALSSATEALDSYQVAKLAGVTPMQAGRTLAKLASRGIATTVDPLSTENDLSARYLLVSAAA